jgi:YVTN family beta-propeller protein
VANSLGDTVTPIDTATNTAGTPINVGEDPDGIAITPSGKTAYVVNARSGTVTPIDVATNTAGTPIGVGNLPDAVAITPNGRNAYVTTQGNDVVLIDTATNKVLTTINVGAGTFALAITPDQAPGASFSATPAPAGSPTGFDASASTAPSSPISKYLWSFGDGAHATTLVPTVSHTYATAGTYTVTLRVKDAAGTSTRRVFTGQTVSRNGGAGALASQAVSISP